MPIVCRSTITGAAIPMPAERVPSRRCVTINCPRHTGVPLPARDETKSGERAA